MVASLKRRSRQARHFNAETTFLIPRPRADAPMTPLTPRRAKLLAAGLAVLFAGAAALVLAGPATAAEWHAYQGDVFPGHAYGLQVPAKAESFEVAWTGPSNASASVAIYDPSGARVGHYALSDALASAVVASPVEGRYVLYVYELTGGALNLRVSAPAAPAALGLQKLPLVREDVPVASADAPARLDKGIAVSLKAPAVFLTLLYEGSAEALDATVSSAKGAALTVTGETGTAFSPGVYSSLSGQRRLDAANLEGTAYTVEVHAKSFEGTLFLTTLAVDFKAPVPEAPVAKAPDAPTAPTAPSSPVAAPANPWNATGGATFAFGEGKAYAFEAKAGELLLADPMVREGKDARNRSYSEYDVHDAVSIYAPDDTLVAYVVLEHDAMNATVKLPVDGEYVAYVHEARDRVVLARLSAASAAPALRELPLVEETFDFAGSSLLGGAGEYDLTLARAPVALALEPAGGGSLDALASAVLENEEGVVASYSALVGGAPGMGWTSVDPSHFRAGEHAFSADGVLGQGYVLTVVSYDRAATLPAAAEHVHAEHHGHEEPPAPPAPAADAALPSLKGLALPAVPGLYG